MIAVLSRCGMMCTRSQPFLPIPFTCLMCGSEMISGPASASPTERETHSPPGHTRSGPRPGAPGFAAPCRCEPWYGGDSGGLLELTSSPLSSGGLLGLTRKQCPEVRRALGFSISSLLTSCRWKMRGGLHHPYLQMVAELCDDAACSLHPLALKCIVLNVWVGEGGGKGILTHSSISKGLVRDSLHPVALM